ncbi:unnamed protein product, partial [Rotaria magnacalcarata]
HLAYTAVLQHRLAIVCITQQLQSIRVDSGLEQAKSPPTGKRQTSEIDLEEKMSRVITAKRIYLYYRKSNSMTDFDGSATR